MIPGLRRTRWTRCCHAWRCRPIGRSRNSRAAGSGACSSAARWSAIPTCCCSTSRPTTWISTRSSGSRSSCCEFAGALLFVTHDRALPAAARHPHRRAGPRRAARPGRAATRTTWRRRPRRSTTEAPRDAQVRQEAREEEVVAPPGQSRRGGRATRAACARSMALRAERAAWRDAPGEVRLARRARPSRSGRWCSTSTTSASAYGEQAGGRATSRMRIMRGDRVGLIGPNGVGKTTLLRLLLGEIDAGQRRVRHGTKLQVAYFDQQREQLDPDRDRRRQRRRRRHGARSTAQRSTCIGYLARLPVPARARASPVSRSRAASATACCWRGCSRGRPTCWCSTSRPTISTSRRSNCSRS